MRESSSIDSREAFAREHGFRPADAFVEFESGAGANALDRRRWPQDALKSAKRLRCSLLVPKLGRLS
ncbi:MAG: hypothetical protein ACQGVK_00600 [Myxococcota bacterium]